MTDEQNNVVSINRSGTGPKPKTGWNGGTKTREYGAEVWDDSLEPGGWVCAVCRTPVESELCDEHYPQVSDHKVHQWKRLGQPEKGTLCGLPAQHSLFPRFNLVNMRSDPRSVTCGDCRYEMQRIEGGPILV